MSSDQMVRSPVGCLVSRLFSRLASDDISYVVLRNYEGLPNSVGHDLDLLLDEGDLARYRSLLRMTAEDCGWKIVRVESRYGYWKCYLYRPDSTERSFLQIDAFYPQHYRGMPWFSSVEVLADRVAYGEFYIPAPGHEAADLLLKELLGSGRVKEAYGARIADLVQVDSKRFISVVSAAFGEETAIALLIACEQQRWTELEQQAHRLRMRLALRAWVTQPWDQFVRTLRFIWGHIAKYLQPSGFFICFIGPDGSGKTSVSEELCAALDWTLFQRVHYVHWRFGIFPELKVFKQVAARLMGRSRKNSGGDRQNGMPDRPHGLARAVGYLLYYTLDYVLGHFVVARARGKGELVILDRYFYDYMIQWTLCSIPQWLPMFLLRFIPTPDVVVFLSNNAEAVYERKQDIPLQEIARQLGICQALTEQLPNACRIEADADLPEVVRRVIEVMMERMTQREALRRRSMA